MSESRKSNLEKHVPACRNTTAESCYIHVPICQRRCRYCDFYSTELVSMAGPVVDGLLGELRLRECDIQKPLKTLFIGGGTPSALDLDSFSRFLGGLGAYIDGNTEFSVEVNCNSLSSEKASAMAASGINRVSIGVQSFNDAELKTLGRLHDSRAAIDAVEKCRRAGIENISVDLIYGIPGQSFQNWKASLRAAIDCGVRHVSCYCLSYPQGTALAAMLDSGQVAAASDAFELDCYHAAIDTLAAAGLVHYEISNFAADGYRCRHNMVYWDNGSYLGLGPSAVSYIGGVRSKNVADIDNWLAATAAGKRAEDFAETESLEGKKLMAETIMLGLRMTDGINLEAFEARFGCDLRREFPKSFTKNIDSGLLRCDGSRLMLTREAFFVSDSVLADFIDEAGQ